VRLLRTTQLSSFVVTANNMTFCLEQVLGNPPTKDCHQAYLDSLKKTKALKTAKK
jgi:hypothetical protein